MKKWFRLKFELGLYFGFWIDNWVSTIVWDKIKVWVRV